MITFNNNDEVPDQNEKDGVLPSHERALIEYKKLDEMKESTRASLLELLAKIQTKGSGGNWVKSKNKGVQTLIQIGAVEVNDHNENLIACTLVGDKILDFNARGIPEDETRNDMQPE